jgi:hypothetical protein
VSVTGQPRDLPAVTDLSAFRIIQEALTNTIRHAGPATAAVTLHYAAEGLAVEVTDTGCGLSASIAETAFAAFLADGAGAGHGLRGMRERAAAAGGVIEIGPLPDGGCRVAARFPLEAAAGAQAAAGSQATAGGQVASGGQATAGGQVASGGQAAAGAQVASGGQAAPPPQSRTHDDSPAGGQQGGHR